MSPGNKWVEKNNLIRQHGAYDKRIRIQNLKSIRKENKSSNFNGPFY